MSFWNLTVAVGNFLTGMFAAITASVAMQAILGGAKEFVFWAVAIFLAGGVFALIAKNYKMVDYFQDSTPNPDTVPRELSAKAKPD